MEAEEDTSNERVATYKVGMLGASGVGKTALTAQFTTSDYICAYDTSLGECTSCVPLFSIVAEISTLLFVKVDWGKISFTAEEGVKKWPLFVPTRWCDGKVETDERREDKKEMAVVKLYLRLLQVPIHLRNDSGNSAGKSMEV